MDQNGPFVAQRHNLAQMYFLYQVCLETYVKYTPKKFHPYHTTSLHHKDQPTRNIISPQPNTYNKDYFCDFIMLLYKGPVTERFPFSQYQLPYILVRKEMVSIKKHQQYLLNNNLPTFQ